VLACFLRETGLAGRPAAPLVATARTVS
jgi:hypothetical protein